MNRERFDLITGNYSRMRVAIVGDFCLDRYLEIDPAKSETSIETGLEVHNVVNVRSQPGAAGTILNNLVALGVSEIYPVGICGEDGEGYELKRALAAKRGVRLDHLIQTAERRTFTYCKPLVLEAGTPPRELNRLDSKNWSKTPRHLEEQICRAIENLAGQVDAIIVMDQVDVANTGVVTDFVIDAIREVVRPRLHIIADSRRTLRGFPRVNLKMNLNELATMTGLKRSATLADIESAAVRLAKSHARQVFVTMAQRGIIGATPSGNAKHVRALPLRGPIDIVGAGDAVTANLALAKASGAMLPDTLKLAMAAASIVIHQLGTTGTASVEQMRELLFGKRRGVDVPKGA